MGVDATMYVIPRNPQTFETVRKLSGDLVEAFGSQYLLIDKYSECPQHALELDFTGQVNVNLSGRYYGIGYERGNWPILKGIAEFLDCRLGEVFYGGDNSEDLNSFKEIEPAITNHFNRHGHTPYHNVFNGDKTHNCSFCLRPFINVGGGAGRDFMICMGCDEKVILYSNGDVKKVKEFQ